MTPQEKRERDKKKKKKQEDWLEAEIRALMEKSMQTALDKSLKEIFKDWKL